MTTGEAMAEWPKVRMPTTTPAYTLRLQIRSEGVSVKRVRILAVVIAVLGSLALGGVAQSATAYKSIASATSRGPDGYASVSASGTTRLGPNVTRFVVRHSADRRVALDWSMYCTDRDYNTWSRSRSVTKRAPFTVKIDNPNYRRCDVSFYASTFAKGKLNVKAQSRY